MPGIFLWDLIETKDDVFLFLTHIKIFYFNSSCLSRLIEPTGGLHVLTPLKNLNSRIYRVVFLLKGPDAQLHRIGTGLARGKERRCIPAGVA